MTLPPEGIAVRNAGLVILNSYFQLLFERLGLLSGQEFVTEDAQRKAVNMLQFVATGLSRAPEPELLLNKIMCGLPVDAPVNDEETVEENERKIVQSMLNAVMAYCPVVSSSIVGFRGNWLIRDGLLADAGDRWKLTVEKRGYDLLLAQCPFSFSVVQLPWMAKPLHVNWGY